MYIYLKAIHIIFVVTWFAGLFYMPRLFIYNTEAADKEPVVKEALRSQFKIMMSKLWYVIAWPSAILTIVFGMILMFKGSWNKVLFEAGGRWLPIKLCFVLLLILYHLSLHKIFKQQVKGIFKYSSQKLRIWNEVATIFLVAIVMLAVVKDGLSFVWGLAGLAGFVIILMGAIKIYKLVRNRK